MQDLGTLPGDGGSGAVGINACGQVVGDSYPSPGGGLHAFIWSVGVGMVGLGVLPGFTNSAAHAINNLGQVIGYCAPPSGVDRAFVWSSAAGMQPLRPLPGGLGSAAVGINDLAEIVGGSDLGNVDKPHAVLWNRAGAPQDLGVLPGGSHSTALAINVFGTVVGNSDCAGSMSHAFVWSANEGMRDLNALIPPAPGLELQGAAAINVAGQIVAAGTLHGTQHAYLLTPLREDVTDPCPAPPTRLTVR
jgi:probable HAF family extracellular repeat protein